MAAEGEDLLRQRLAELGPKPWHASGSLQPPQGSLTLSFEHEGRISLPLGAEPPPDDALQALQALLAAASPSPFAKQASLFGWGIYVGCRGKTVVDPSYRAALELAPGAFESGVALPPTGVLAEAAAVLAPDARDMCAELIKLNIYGPGAFFKAHRDTPMGAKHVGSLVVCLPCGPHQGGDLVLRHQGQEHRWSTAEAVAGAAAGAPHLQWCAFFADVEHEVLPVSAGYRLTFSYNLYSAPRPPAAKAGGKRKAGEQRGLPTTRASLAAAAHAPELSADRDAPGAVAALRTLLADSTWHPGGGKLGVILRHKYAAGLEGLRDNMFPAALKGRDRLLYAMFASCGLEVRTSPIFKGWEEPEDYDPYEDAMAGLQFRGEQGPLPTREEWYLQASG
ncbi:2OG-Fe(II) oxygenase family [Chlorella sorokiniana]|uniref:2OG-Fe(II) oxygenase family n=1 Tax=Chlorella sorokiniana TaxID=3076 RepID=A0A2P6TPG5_CHLSO|nr:2OG-Fe(II) oxygenase family [Chlorella sorokiniana]|eukprot:PRW55927.1 2OG-Fe(II) oxygenase family [Chlorella sorokiniana]